MFSPLFSAIGVRIICAMLTSLSIALVIGPRVIENLRIRQIGQNIREEGVAAHKKKAGIPTMGGVIILIPFVITIILWAKFNPFVWVVFASTLGLGFIGMLDDLTKVLKARSLGLTPRQKLAGQIVIGIVAGLIIRYYEGLRFDMPSAAGALQNLFSATPSSIQVPFSSTLDLNFLYLPFVALVMTASTNAVNLTDGLDGLAGGTICTAIIPYLFICLISGSPTFSTMFGVLYIPGSEELAVVCSATLGGVLGFLWYNAHPAEVFMGDTGSLAVGGTFGGLAICTKTELFWLIIGGLFVIETLSVIIQVAYFKHTNGQRIFRMSPIHHHFELCGWPEEKVVTRFWITGFLFGLAGMILFLWKGF